MPLIADEDSKYLREQFAALATDVTLTLVMRERSKLVLPGAAPEPPEDASAELKAIIDEVAATSPRLKVVAVDARTEADRARELAGELTPAIVFSGGKVKGKLRYFGLPAGYEMSTLIATVMDVGSGESMVPPEVADELAKIDRDVHIKVFVTPSCPHCPAMARAAFQLAMSSEKIIADVYEAEEFPEVAARYQLRGVPMTLINDGEPIMGNVGGAKLLGAVLQTALSKP